MTLSGRYTFAIAIAAATMLSGCGDKATVLGPDKQAAFSEIIERCKEKFKSAGSNEVKKSMSRIERGKEIKELVEGSHKVSFVKWACRVDTLLTETSGDIDKFNLECGSFKIKLIGKISKNADLYSSIARQSIGGNDEVRVSGEFDVDTKNTRNDWLSEGSGTEFGSVLYPDILAKKLITIEKITP